MEDEQRPLHLLMYLAVVANSKRPILLLLPQILVQPLHLPHLQQQQL
jgi:hypothetical protein